VFLSSIRSWSELTTPSQPHQLRLLIASEEHYALAQSGAIYSTGPAVYSAWSRYLGLFDQVVVVARVQENHGQENHRQRADGPGVCFRVLPDFTGPWQYFRIRHQVQAIVHNAVAECNSYLLRVPGLVGQMAWREIMRANKRYAVEVLGDPWDALSPGSWPNISRPFFRLMATNQMKRICAGAMAVNYVVSRKSQKRYPAAENSYVATFSDVMLEDTQAAANILQERHNRLRQLPWREMWSGSFFRLGFIGSFSRMYKGADALLRAAALCHHRGLNFSLNIVGEGRHLPQMKLLAAELGIADRAQFLGQLSFGRQIFNFLDSIDLFVIPSRAEGMPRALIEAMARGCPCVGSAVGGISELLDPENLVPAANPERLAELILQVASDSERLVAMSERNIAAAQQFKPEIIQQARRAFLEAVKNRSLIR
jgi:glycosyltransferase involved in cell wall biosynthesis